MKRIYLFLVFWGLLSVSLSLGETTANNLRGGTDEIDLSNNYPDSKSRSLLLPIQAFNASQSIEAYFYEALGNITVSIYDETGNAVYQQSVNTNAQQQLSIDITSLAGGLYTIEFVNSQTNLHGKFEI